MRRFRHNIPQGAARRCKSSFTPDALRYVAVSRWPYRNATHPVWTTERTFNPTTEVHLLSIISHSLLESNHMDPFQTEKSPKIPSGLRHSANKTDKVRSVSITFTSIISQMWRHTSWSSADSFCFPLWHHLDLVVIQAAFVNLSKHTSQIHHTAIQSQKIYLSAHLVIPSYACLSVKGFLSTSAADPFHSIIGWQSI